MLTNEQARKNRFAPSVASHRLVIHAPNKCLSNGPPSTADQLRFSQIVPNDRLVRACHSRNSLAVRRSARR